MTQQQTTETPEIDALADWEPHKILAAVYEHSGAEALTTMLEQAGLSHETLLDAAVELERRSLGHIAKLLWEAAKTARSQVDDIIEKEEPDYIKCYGPDSVETRKQRKLVYRLYQRIKVTGQSWNATVRHYGIEEWVGLKDKDFTLDGTNTVRFVADGGPESAG